MTVDDDAELIHRDRRVRAGNLLDSRCVQTSG